MKNELSRWKSTDDICTRFRLQSHSFAYLTLFHCQDVIAHWLIFFRSGSTRRTFSRIAETSEWMTKRALSFSRIDDESRKMSDTVVTTCLFRCSCPPLVTLVLFRKQDFKVGSMETTYRERERERKSTRYGQYRKKEWTVQRTTAN